MNSWFTSHKDRSALSNVATSSHRIRRVTIAGYVLAFACLFWVFRDFDLAGLLRRVEKMDPSWIVAALLCYVLSYVCQGVRWQLLLRPLSTVTVLSTTQAIYAGLFVNDVLPLRLGEVARAALISRWTALKLRSIIASILIERLCDGFWLAVGVVAVMILVPLPRKLIEAGDVFAIAILVALIAFSFLLFTARTKWAKSVTPQSSDTPRPLITMFITLLRGALLDLRNVSYGLNAVLACIFSLTMLQLQGLSLWFVMRAYGLHVPVAAGLVVFLIMHLGTMVPAAPANVGTYQFFTVLGLTLFGVDKTTAVGFSLVAFGILNIPLLMIGFWAFASSGLTLLEVRSGVT
jgi:hypothetical protein